MESDDANSHYSDLTAFSEKLHQVRERMAAAARRGGRDPGSVTLVAVTKMQAAAQVALAAQAGLSDVGENYIQEAQVKRPAAEELLRGSKVTWHFIGHLQSNKARFAVDFDLIHTVDSVKLATELNKQAAHRDKVQAVLLEVNTARQQERAGVLAEDTLRLAAEIEQMPNLLLRGLMTIAPVADDADQARSVFRQMRDLWDTLPEQARQVLSMGMSGDFEAAIEEGATHIRLGTALFGARPARTA